MTAEAETRGGKLILLHGLPGSGKSAYTNQYIHDHPSENVVVVNRDTIRENLFGASYHSRTPDKKSEQQITEVQNKMLQDALSSGKTVIDDNTNLNPRFLAQTVKLARDYGAVIGQEYMNVPIEECKRRNKLRGEHGGRFVPEHVIDRMAAGAYDSEGNLKEFVLSKNGVFAVSKTTPGQKLLAEKNKELENKYSTGSKSVVLVDCDGTLCNNDYHAKFFLGNPNNKKKNFDGFYRGITYAPVNENVCNLANSMHDNDNINIVVLTGRDDSRTKELLDFIERSGIKASRVINKRSGDFRPDGEFKAEVLSKLASEGFIVVHAIDDRDSSIKCMEDAGVTVSRVEHPQVNIDFSADAPPEAAPAPNVATIYGNGQCIRCGSKLKSGNIGARCATKQKI